MRNILLITIILLPYIGWWKVFEKSQQRGWKILIPIYNIFIFLKIIKRTYWWILLYIIPVLIASIFPYAISIFLVVLMIDFWQLNTVFGRNINFYKKWHRAESHRDRLIIAMLLFPLKAFTNLIYGFWGFPHIAFNSKSIYSLHYLNEKEELNDITYSNQIKESPEESFRVKERIKILEIPLFVDSVFELFSDDSNKESEDDKYLGWDVILSSWSFVALFIYYWIVDWGKPGFTDMDISKIHNPLAKKSLEILHSEKNNSSEILLNDKVAPVIDFFADVILYFFCSMIGFVIVLFLLNVIFRILNNLYWKILVFIKRS